MAAPEARHESRHAEGAAGDVDARDAGKIRAGQQQVLMAEKHRVDAPEPAPAPGRRSPPLAAAPAARNAGMAQRDDEIDFSAQRGQILARRLGDARWW